MPYKKPQRDNVGLILPPEEIAAYRKAGVNVDVHWGEGEFDWFPWQKRVLTCLADEIGLFGGKDSGKSSVMRGWLISGNPDQPLYDEDDQKILVNWSYVYHPDYWGLILRKNAKDLEFFISRAQRLWEPLGAIYKNGYFEFLPWGSRIDCGHMADETAWHKYIGNEYQRAVIDESALIPEYSQIEELRSGMRSSDPALRTQIMYASNAGGPGTGWILDRFMRVKDKFGNIIPHDQIIEEEWNHPFTKQVVKQTRIWIFSTIADNPMAKGTKYAAVLANLTDEKRRRAYFEGQWDAFYGQYFSTFRPDGPRIGEPDAANHVIKSDKMILKPWWNRVMAMDWGFAHETAVLWGCMNPHQQLNVYREMAVTHTGPEQIGYEIAMLTRPELQASPSKTITLYLSHDAFQQRSDAKTYAELVYKGISRVLGPNAVHLPDVLIKQVEDEFAKEVWSVDGLMKKDSIIKNILDQKRTGIVIRKADKTNVIGWQYCREVMRFMPIGAPNAVYDEDTYRMLVQADPASAVLYKDTFRSGAAIDEVLPKLLISDLCPRLIQALPKAQHEEGTENVDKGHFFGKDLVDAFHYLVLGSRNEAATEPKEYYIERQVQEVLKQHPDIDFTALCHVNRQLEEEWRIKEMGKQGPLIIKTGVRGRRMSLNQKTFILKED